LDLEGAIEDVVVEKGNGRSRHQAQVRPAAQAHRAVVLYFTDHHPLTGLEGIQGPKVTAGQVALLVI
jgi:hypothetical protein